MRKRLRLFSMQVLILVLAACSGGGSVGPVTECTAADRRGAAWTRADLSPLGAEDAALIACGQQSADPTTCAVSTCQPRW